MPRTKKPDPRFPFKLTLSQRKILAEASTPSATPGITRFFSRSACGPIQR
jgi:hypothetical protein